MTSASDSPSLDREFLVIRAKILEIAAALDRIQRTEGLPVDDPRVQQIAHSIKILMNDHSAGSAESTELTGQAERAKAVQMIFSLPYNESWRSDFGI